MKKTEKKNYEAPALTVVHYKTERGYLASSVTMNSLATISRAFIDNGGDAWGGSALSDGSSLASWEDYGNNPWQ